MSKKIKINFERIIDEINNCDSRLLIAMIDVLFSDNELKQFDIGDVIHSPKMIAALIVLRAKGLDYVNFLKRIIKQNNKYFHHDYNTTMTYEELAKTAKKVAESKATTIKQQYFQLLLKFYSVNIFKGTTVDKLKEKCKEILEEYILNEKERSKIDKKLVIELFDELKDSKVETMLNGFANEYPGYESYFNKYDSKALEKNFGCKYDSEKKEFNNVRRGILYFVYEYFYNVVDAYAKAVIVVNRNVKSVNAILDEKEKLAGIRKNYFADKDKLLQIKKANKNLKKENKRLNTQVLKKIDKSNNQELENRVHNLEKDKYYLQSRIEKMEEQIAVFEEEKKLNKALQENVEVKELPKKDKLAFSETEPPIIAELPEYQNIVIMGGRWTSNHRKEVTEYLANNEVEFIEADKTLRYFDRIKNADIIFYDTSYNAHSYYYKAKKLGAVFYHVNTSNLSELKKIYEKSE